MFSPSRNRRHAGKEGLILKRIRVAVLGFGNVGCRVVEALEIAPDMVLAGIVLPDSDERSRACRALKDVPVASSLERLEAVDIAVLAVPSRCVPEIAPSVLSRGIATVDCFDIHGEPLSRLRACLDAAAKEAGTVAVTAAGWDPGTDSTARTLMEIVAPRGVTYTNFGPGMSMGHTVVAKTCEGVADALSLTLPEGWGLHSRHIYVKLKEGYAFDEVTARIACDPYFVHDRCSFFPCDDIKAIADSGHGVRMERLGSSGTTSNQRLAFSMTVDNPAATGQVLVSSARAAMRQKPGCYTVPEIPPIDFLFGDREQLLKRLV
jgi:diaminopimelate dehydrogenase